jgi:hypothetical protein
VYTLPIVGLTVTGDAHTQALPLEFTQEEGSGVTLMFELYSINQISTQSGPERLATNFKESRRMLKITRVRSVSHEVTLQLDGRVTGQWIELLRESAESVLAEGLQLTLDWENICFIDCEGLALIKNLRRRGVRQINAPLFVAEQIKDCDEA